METLMETVLDASLKGAAVLGLALLATAAMRRRSAAARHLVWTVAVAAALMMPLLSLSLPGWAVLPAWGGSAESQTAERAEAAPDASGMPSVHAEGADDTVGPPPAERTPHEESDAPRMTGVTGESALQQTERTAEKAGGGFVAILLRWLPWVWLGGAVFALVPLVLGWLSLAHLRRTAEPVAHPAWLELCDRLCNQIRLRRRVTLLRTACRTMPMTWGVLPWLPAVVLIPEEAETWPAQRRRAVLLHELAHVRRWDCLTQVFTQIACAVYWFNPLMWFAAQRMLLERERACDDVVLLHETDSTDYAEHLLAIATGPQSGFFAIQAGIAMARRSKLDGRVVAILDKRRNRRAMSRLGAAVTIAMLGAVAVPLAMIQAEVGPGTSADGNARDGFSETTEVAVPRREDARSLADRFAFVDLDTGQRHRPAGEIGLADADPPVATIDWTEQLVAWAHEHSVDVVLNEDDEGRVWVLAIDTVLRSARGRGALPEPPSAQPWDRLRPAAALSAVADDAPERVEGDVTAHTIFPIAPGEMPVSRFFRTAERSAGALRIRFDDERDQAVVAVRRVDQPPHEVAPEVSSAAADGEPGEFGVMMEGGRRAALLGLRRISPEAGAYAGWWQPDGSRLAEEPYPERGVDGAEEAAFELAIELSSPHIEAAARVPEGTDAWFIPGRDKEEIEKVDRATTAHVMHGEEPMFRSLLLGLREPDQRAVDLELGVAAGPWREVAHWEFPWEEPSNGEEARAMGLRISQPERAPSGGKVVQIDVGHEPTNHAARLIVVDTDGEERVGFRLPRRFGAFTHRYVFRQLTVADIETIVFQTQPYRWVEFRNISLQPGQETEVQVHVEAEDGGPEDGDASDVEQHTRKVNEEAVIESLERLVAIQKGMLERVRQVHEAERASDREVWDAERSLLEAELRLAEARGEREAVIGSLEQLVAIQRRTLESVRQVHEAGRASDREVWDAERSLLEAELRLAGARGEREAVIESLEQLVKIQRRTLERVRQLHGTGRASDREVWDAERSLLEAEIRLQEARGD